MVKAAISLLLLAAVAAAAPRDPVEASVDSYLRAAAADEAPRAQRPFGVVAAGADGGIFGWLNVRLLAWYPSLKGSVNHQSGGELSLKTDLGLDDNALTLVPQVTVNFLIFGFRVDAFSASYDGAGTISRTLTFGGRTFTINEDVVSSIKVKNFRSLGLIRFVNTSNLRLAVILGFSYFDYDFNVVGSTTGPASVSGVLPAPLVGLLAQGRFGNFMVEAEVSGFYVSYSGNDVTLIDASVSVAYRIVKVLDARVGYRYISIDGRLAGSSANIRMDGFFIGIGVTF